MFILNPTTNENGAYNPAQTWSLTMPPEGFIVCPEEFIPTFTSANGFVSITLDDNGVVAKMTEDTKARLAWEASLPPAPIPEPTIEETLLELTADQEYRLCMIELGLK